MVQRAVEYLEKEGLTVMGIFRRAPNNVKVKAIKRRFDQGDWWVWQWLDGCSVMMAVVCGLIVGESCIGEWV